VKNQPYYMYPFIHLLNNGNLFVFVSKMSQIFNVATLPELATVERQQLRSRYHHLRWWPVPRHHCADRRALGYYMLFVIPNGVPSVGQMIMLN